MLPLSIYIRPQRRRPRYGVTPGTAFEDLPDDWICPLCGDRKDLFEEKD